MCNFYYMYIHIGDDYHVGEMNNDFNKENEIYNKKIDDDKIDKISNNFKNLFSDSASNWIISRNKNLYMWNCMIRFFALGTYIFFLYSFLYLS